MHYLNDPLCFSQSGCCRRLINLTCLLCCTQRGQTHIAYSKCTLRHPPFFSQSLFPLTAAIKTYTLCINHQIIIQIDEIVMYANEQTMGRWSFCIMNAVFFLMVIRFATVYICTTVVGHKDVVMTLLIDLHALLIFQQVYPLLTFISICGCRRCAGVLNWCKWSIKSDNACFTRPLTFCSSCCLLFRIVLMLFVSFNRPDRWRPLNFNHLKNRIIVVDINQI